MQTFVVKLASGVAAFVAGVSIDWVGLVTTDEETAVGLIQPEGSLMGLRLVMTLVPIALLVVALVFFLKKYLLTDEKLQDIQTQLAERKG
jgi:melibiose permease